MSAVLRCGGPHIATTRAEKLSPEVAVIVGREDVGGASGSASPASTSRVRRVGGLGPGLTSEFG
jgi:hypothetical protein